ncbi:MAG: anaerobic ribonucleoside-triphosphate reductase activating protein [Candidatus Gottesmanbacteria bacterium]
MNIRGLQKTTLLDYPGKIAGIIFTSGCNFRCPFCQNPDLVIDNDKLPNIDEEEIFKFLKSRAGKLEGVVITGGEPTIQNDLPEFIAKIKDMKYLVKLDTNGTNPGMVEELIKNGLVDYIAVDYKGPFYKYYKYIGKDIGYRVKGTVKKIINILVKNEMPFELRTTVVPTLHIKEDLIAMAQELNSLYPKPSTLNPKFKWFLQNFRPDKCLDSSFEKIKPYPKSFYDKVLPELRKFIPKTEVRGI